MDRTTVATINHELKWRTINATAYGYQLLRLDGDRSTSCDKTQDIFLRLTRHRDNRGIDLLDRVMRPGQSQVVQHGGRAALQAHSATPVVCIVRPLRFELLGLSTFMRPPTDQPTD